MSDEIKLEIEREVKRQISAELDKTYRKIIRRKSFKIFVKNVLIIALLGLIALLSYVIYDEGYFDNEPEPLENVVEPGKTLEKENLIDTYAYLLDKINISEKSKYVKDFYEGNLSNEVKNYLTMNLIELDKYSDDLTIIDNETFKNAYETLFDDYKECSFVYNNSNVNYAKKINSYVINNKLKKEESRIKRDIINIEEFDDYIQISTIEYIEKHDKKYNVLTNKEEDNIDNLTKIKYTFKGNILTKIEK